jgi:SAM-dependent methyltransferase
MLIFLKTRFRDFKYLFNLYWFSFWDSKTKKLEQNLPNPSQREINDAIEFTINNVGYIIGFLPNESPIYLNGKTILEIGPGQDFGVPLLLMGFGVTKAILIDKFFCEWNENFHPEYYRKLLGKAQQSYPETDFKDLKNVIKSNSHISDRLELFTFGLENASSIPKESVDISFSNACFEHLEDSQAAVKELGRITKFGGLGFHQIDFRDHRNYDKPLEFLTMPDWLFKKALVLTKACHGNRLRYTEFAHFFEESGFDQSFSADMFCEENYLKNILSRANSKYKKMPLDSINVLGGRFFLKKNLNNLTNLEIEIAIIDKARIFFKQENDYGNTAKNTFDLFKDKFQKLLKTVESKGIGRDILILIYEADFIEIHPLFEKYSNEELSKIAEKHLSKIRTNG